MRPCYVCTSAGQPPNKALFEEVLFCRSNGTPLTCRSCIQPANDTGELGREGGDERGPWGGERWGRRWEGWREKSCLKRTCLMKSNHTPHPWALIQLSSLAVWKSERYCWCARKQNGGLGMRLNPQVDNTEQIKDRN